MKVCCQLSDDMSSHWHQQACNTGVTVAAAEARLGAWASLRTLGLLHIPNLIWFAMSDGYAQLRVESHLPSIT